MTYFLNFLWLLISVFLILVVLVQRGRGGGLAGALGGAGGSSAFGTKAGDVFTKITVGVFVVWLLMALLLVPMMAKQQKFEGGSDADPSLVADDEPGTGEDAPPPPADGAESESEEEPSEETDAKSEAEPKVEEKAEKESEAATPKG